MKDVTEMKFRFQQLRRVLVSPVVSVLTDCMWWNMMFMWAVISFTTAAGEVADGTERWLMGRRGGWQYLLSCCPSSCLCNIILLTLGVFLLQTFLFTVFVRYQWQQRLKLSTLQTLLLIWAQCSEVFWHLRDSTPPWTQTETGAAGGQISDQVTVFPQTPLRLSVNWWLMGNRDMDSVQNFTVVFVCSSSVTHSDTLRWYFQQDNLQQ